MNKMIRSLRSTLGTAFVLCGRALTLLSATAVASDSQASGGAEQRQHDRKGGRDVGLRGHGFVADNGVFTTIDAPGAGLYTVAFGIDDRGRTVGGYVDDRGRLHGFLKDKEAFTVIDFPGAAATFASRINAQGQIVGAYSDEPQHARARACPTGSCSTTASSPRSMSRAPCGPNPSASTTMARSSASTSMPTGVPRVPAGQWRLHHDRCARRHVNLRHRHRRQRPDRGHSLVDAAGAVHGFLRDAAGVFTPIDVPGAAADPALRDQQSRPDRRLLRRRRRR